MDESKSIRVLGIQCYACEKRSIPKMQSEDGKDKCQIYRCSLLSENYNGEPIAFGWNVFAGSTASEILQKMQKDFEGQRIRPGSFSDRIIFMSMFKKSIWTRKGTKTLAKSIREKIKMYASRFIDRQMGSPCFTNCEGIREFWKPCIQWSKSAGSRNIENEKWSKHYPPQWRVLLHRFSFQKCPCGESALFLRSSHNAV